MTPPATTSRSKPFCDRSALRPEADTLNRMVRSRFTPPERESFKPAALRAPSNPLNYRAFNIRTKMAVVRLLRRKWAERDGNRPKVAPRAGRRGSDNLPGMAAVCGFPTADPERKKNVPTGVLAERKRLEPSVNYSAIRTPACPDSPNAHARFTVDIGGSGHWLIRLSCKSSKAPSLTSSRSRSMFRSTICRRHSIAQAGWVRAACLVQLCCERT